jgi:hypothetical protein
MRVANSTLNNVFRQNTIYWTNSKGMLIVIDGEAPISTLEKVAKSMF